MLPDALKTGIGEEMRLPARSTNFTSCCLLGSAGSTSSAACSEETKNRTLQRAEVQWTDGRQRVRASAASGGASPHVAWRGRPFIRRDGSRGSRLLARHDAGGQIAGDVVRHGGPTGSAGREWTFTPTSEIYWRSSRARTLVMRWSADTPSDITPSLARQKISMARAVRAHLGDVTVPILALDDLITNKRAAGRPQDLADVALLERVRNRK